MKRKIIFGILFLLIGFSFYKRYEIYYFFQGKKYLKPNESVQLAVRPKTEQIEYSSELYIESDEQIVLKLEGKDVWYEMEGWTHNKTGHTTYFYLVTEQVIKKYDSGIYENVIVVETGLKSATIEGEGIIVPLKGERKYSMTEDYDYTITITNLSNKPVAFSAFVVNR